MLKLSKKVEYAIISLLEMADNHDESPVTARMIASKYRIPPEILGKVLQTMVKKDFLTSLQGVKGGYRLNKPLEAIDVLAVVEAVEGPITLISCKSTDMEYCRQVLNCTIKMPMHVIQNELVQFFNSITLQELKNKQFSKEPMVAAGGN